MWMEEDADKRVNEIRAAELAETGCDTVAVGCPFCSVMVKDGLDAVGAEMEVLDVAELLWEQIVAKDKEIHDNSTNRSGKARIWKSSISDFV